MAMQDAGPLQTPADAGGISGGSENVCIRTSLIKSAAAGISRDGSRRSRAVSCN